MAQLISLMQFDKESKIAILEGLGYKSDGIYVLTENGDRYIDKYINTPVRLDDMLILPGSTVIISNNEISILGYIEEYGDATF
jgi:hypothetical protein